MLELTLPEAILYLRAITLTFSQPDDKETTSESLFDMVKPENSYTHQGTLTEEEIKRFTDGK